MKTTTYSAPHDAGAFLCAVELNRAKLTKAVCIRTAVVAAAVFVQRDMWQKSWGTMLVCVLFYACFALFPLLHKKDHMEYYTHAIRYNGVSYPLSSPEAVAWSSFAYLVFTTQYLKLDKAKLDITYLKDAKKEFYRVYTLN